MLQGHVVAGAVASQDVVAVGEAPMAGTDGVLTFTPADDGGLAVDAVVIGEANVAVSNGVIHGVLLPADEPMKDEAPGDVGDSRLWLAAQRLGSGALPLGRAPQSLADSAATPQRPASEIRTPPSHRRPGIGAPKTSV